MHVGGKHLDSIQLSALRHPPPPLGDEEDEDEDEEQGGGGGGDVARVIEDFDCYMSSSGAVSLGMGAIEQILSVPAESRDEDDKGSSPLVFFARAGAEGG